MRALVTGATGGIGGAIARAFAGAGARVCVSGRREGALEELVGELGEGSCAAACDIGDAKEADGLVARAEEGLGGGLDVLVSNAGLTRDGLLLRMKDEDWDEVLAVNLTAAFRLSRAALRGMLKRRRGRLIYVGSAVGRMGNAGQANYAASKAGLEGLARALAREVGSRGVTVNVLAPGYVETEMTRMLGEGVVEGVKLATPLGRTGRVEEMAHAALYLASESGGYMTGQTLHVNGGLLMG